MNKPYRPCVLAVFTNEKGLVLVCERNDAPGSWQFPQGGMDEGESPQKALEREMQEELGVFSFNIIRKGAELVRYEFPEGVKKRHSDLFRGQEQHWFLTTFTNGDGPDLSKATDKEFVAYQWVDVQTALERVISFKKEAYLNGLRGLGLL